MTPPRPSKEISTLLKIMADLRDPVHGCAWDLKQDFASIAPYAVEEAYEVVEAIGRGDMENLREELGDLLLQVVFHAQMAKESHLFDFGDVVEAITAKLIRRHPHVFGDAKPLSPEAVEALWDTIKTQEKKASGFEAPGLLHDVPRHCPALMRADKLTRKAAEVGFDWKDASQVIGKIEEEFQEMREAMETGDKEAVQDEIGDLLFAVANLARHLGIDPEAALQGTNAKFMRRFASIEKGLADAKIDLVDASLDEMEALWIEAKAVEQ